MPLTRFSQTGVDTKVLTPAELGGPDFSVRVMFDNVKVTSIVTDPPPESAYQPVAAFKIEAPKSGVACGQNAVFFLNTGISRVTWVLRNLTPAGSASKPANQPTVYYQVRTTVNSVPEVVWQGKRSTPLWTEIDGRIVQVTGELGEGFELWACPVAATATTIELHVECIADRQSGPQPIETGRYVTTVP